MNALGFRNRSENAMTSEHFQCFDGNDTWDLVTGKLKQLGGLEGHPESSTKGQIFAHPWRDYLHHKAFEAKKKNKYSSLKKAHLEIKQKADSRIVEIYEQEFSDLQDNGGPTKTHALLEGSPAIGAGDQEAAPDKDQRGVSRPQGNGSDIGAYEG